MALRFTFRETPVTILNKKRADPNKIGYALHAVSEANQGRLTRRAALDAARNPKNAMHRHVEWRDKVAAEAYRLEQIGELIRLVVRADDDAGVQPARAFLSIRDKDGTSYRGVDEILGSRDLQLMVLLAAERDLRAWTNRYQELNDICSLVRTAQGRLQSKIEAQKGKEARA